MKKSQYIREAVISMFENLAVFICKYSWQVCIISFLFNGLLGLGMLNLRRSKLLNNDIDDLFIPKNNPTQKITQNLLKLFPDTSGHDFYAHQSVRQPVFGEILLWRRDGGNILEGTSHGDLAYVMNYIHNMSVLSENGTYVSYVDICVKRDNNCVIQGQEFIDLIKNNTNGEIDIAQLYHRDGHHYEDSLTSIAEYVVDNRMLEKAKYLKLRFNLRHDTAGMVKESKRWQGQFVNTLKDLQNEHLRKSRDDEALKALTFVFRHANSFYEELGNDTYPDIRYVSFVFFIFFTYIGFVTSGGNCLSKRMNLARMGYITLPVSVLGAWGLLMACGVEFTNPIGIVPIYLIGQHTISTMVTLSHLSDACGLETAHERVVYVMRNSALPLTVTLLTHMTSCAVGIASSYYVLKLVCIYFVVTLMFGYINHFVFFMSTVAIHEQRIDKGLHFCSCTKLRHREELTDAGRSCCVVCCCSGERPETRDDTESCIERMSRKLMTGLLLTTPAKVVCVLGFLVYTGFYIWGLVHYNVDSIQESEVTAASYLSDWQSQWDMRFENESTVQFVFVHPNGFLKERKIIDDFKHALLLKEYVYARSLQSWYDSFFKSTHNNITSESDFVQSINTEFLPRNPVFRHDVLLDTVSQRVIASRVYIKIHDFSSTKPMINIKKDLYDLTETFNDMAKYKLENEDNGKDGDHYDNNDNETVNILVYSPSFQHTDGHMLPLWEILKICSVQFGLMFTLLLILNPNVILSLHIVICYFSIVAGMFGMSYFFGAYLNQITMLSYLIASCYSVEVVGHTLYSIMNVTGTGRGARMNVVINSVSQAVYHPLVGQTLGLVVLVVCASYFFRSVFVIFITATCICVVHVVFFMPTVLSLLGPGDNVSDDLVISEDSFYVDSKGMQNNMNTFIHRVDQNDSDRSLKARNSQRHSSTNYGFQQENV